MHKKIPKLILGFMVSLSGSLLFAGNDAWTDNGSHFSYTKTGKIAPQNITGGGVKYQFSLGAPRYSFNAATGTCNPGSLTYEGNKTSGPASSVTGAIEYTVNNLPTADVDMSMSGNLIPPAGGSGSPPTWSADAKLRAPFWLTPTEKIFAEGTAVTITANGAPTESTWSVNSKAWKDWTTTGSQPYKTSSITLNRNMWDKMQWTPSTIPTGWLCPPAGAYNISATTTETSGARSASANVYVLKLQDVRVKPSGSSSSQNVVVETGSKLDISVTALPSDTINGEKLPFRWYIQQMQNSGSYGSWTAIAAGNDKSSFEYTTTTGGIFRVKVEVKKGDAEITAELLRQSDDQHSKLKKDDPDAFGVCDTNTQISMRSDASGKLGYTLWAYSKERTHTRPFPDTVWPAQGPYGVPSGYKCNLFVCEVGDDAGIEIPLINGTVPRYPPTANQWANVSFSISGWSVVAGTTQPGYVWAHAADPNGHCGIVDYDGRVISAGQFNVNRNENRNGTLRKK